MLGKDVEVELVCLIIRIVPRALCIGKNLFWTYSAEAKLLTIDVY